MGMMKLGLAGVALLASAGAALAWTPSAEAVKAAERGEVWRSVQADPQGAAALARGVVHIDAPPAVVWKMMIDCATVRRVMPSNRGCKTLERDPAGRWEVTEHIVKTPLMPNVRTVFRQDFEPQKRIRITRVDGDLKVIGGEWRVEALPGGGTRVSQEMRMTPGFPAPGPMVRSFLKNEIAVGLANLKREAEARS